MPCLSVLQYISQVVMPGFSVIANSPTSLSYLLSTSFTEFKIYPRFTRLCTISRKQKCDRELFFKGALVKIVLHFSVVPLMGNIRGTLQ